uniref:SMC hinge domain-containing protein n=1 Tax=Oryza meridionalis TaxID=40149 RepID=A0A0E0CF24_9ORYZ
MYIKKVVVEGFKSYREEISTEPFSPKVNVVVGANGSGKSNFFHAIRFVLSDMFQNLRSEDRGALLHEGADISVLSAFVEIVFDNSDNRIPVEKKVVRLRRTVASKKDEYYLDGKHVSKTEVMNLLENAGFSHSNPYYVFQQGKIAALTLMKDSERLELLKEIGANKRKQIDQVVHYLEERLRELDEEKEEMKKYQQLDKQRRSLEYTILDHELNDTRNELALMDDNRRKISERMSHADNEVVGAREKIRSFEKEIKFSTKGINDNKAQKEDVEKKCTEVLKVVAQIELDLRDIKDRILNEKLAKNEAARDSQSVRMESERSKSELAETSKGRATQFANKAARDKWLQKEIDDLERGGLLQEEIQKLKDKINNLNSYFEFYESESNKLESTLAKKHSDYNDLRKQRDKLQEERKSFWMEEANVTAEKDRLEKDLVNAKEKLGNATPGEIIRVLNCVSRITMEHGITGVVGPILELIDCDEKLFTAVEVTARNSLFHVVVENDDISTKIIQVLTREKGGRVTFIPLNRVKVPDVSYPRSDDFVPLLERLECSKANHRRAFEQVFGRTVICKDLETATKVARDNGLNCITLDGDQVARKGHMTGGFHDYRCSKLKFVKTIKNNMKAIEDKEEHLKNVERNLNKKMTDLVTKQQQMDAESDYAKSELEHFKVGIASTMKQIGSLEKALGKKEKSLDNIQNQIVQIQSGIAMKYNEMGTEIIDQLTSEERDLLLQLNTELTELKEKFIETRKEELEANLSTNLMRRQKEFEAVTSSADSKTLSLEAESKEQELNSSKSSLDDLTAMLKANVDAINNFTIKMEELKRQRDNLKTLEANLDQTVRDGAKDLEQLMSSRSMHLAKQEECMKKIRDLGPLPTDAFETYRQKNKKQLQKMLYNCNEQLQQFRHVKKKALDSVNFTEQREQLERRRAELDAGDQKIRELMSILDQRKDESIKRTFKGVARHFREVFSELVQGGHGHLVMMKKKDGDAANEDIDNDEDGPREPDPEDRMEKYIGVKVKVSFTGQGETQSMKQLSGGQKTVVALTLIFAIQRCDPAPFYLFDEIDAALDTQYRTAVGNMIRHLADMADTQFIATTFRPEIVKVADKIYGVTYKNRVVIEGFKSYREEISTEPFSPKVNVVVGANGSGKSNFFHAIRFVLSDMFQNLRSEDRGALLHEGAGHSVVSAFVEIVFDNSDNRIPVDKEEVRLRRTVASKKDEYYLDGKHVSKTEVMNLLESAGFSRSNPYYVVQQGKIASLTLMKDSERLDLLKEIGGETSCEWTFIHALLTANKRKQIDQVVHYLEERLRELDEEKEELKKYQQLDKQRRSLEYTILDHELNEARNELASMDDNRRKISERMSHADNEVVDVREKVKTFDKEIKYSTKGINDTKAQKEGVEKKRTEALKVVAQIELDLRDIKDRILNEKRAKDEAAKDLQSVRMESEKSKSELAEISKVHQAKLKEEEEISKSIMDREKRLSILYQKQGRATQFTNKAARDKWLQKEIDDLERVLLSNRKQEGLLQEEIQKLKDEINNLNSYIESRKSESSKLESALAKKHNDYNDLRKQRDELQEERKSFWKEEADVTAEIDRLKDDLVKAQKSLDHATPGDIRRGLNSVSRIIRDHGITGVFGPVLELVDCEEKFFTAVEVTAGNSLFHVVVENDDISTRIIQVLTREKGGRVTFIPLNRVKVPDVFGRTVICRDLETATKVARGNGLDCITLDGDQVARKGGMTGGFYDSRRSKLKFVKIIRDNKTAIEKKAAHLENQQMDAERDHAKSELEQFKVDIASAMKQMASLDKALGKKEKSLDNIRNQIEQIQSGIAMKNDEMGTELIDQLTSEERDLLSRLNPEITELKEKFLLCKNSRIEIETRKEELETNLSTNLMRRQKELEAIISSADSKTLPLEAESKEQELKSSKRSLDELTAMLKANVDAINNFTRKMEELKRQRDDLKALEANLEQTVQDGAKDLEQLMSSRSMHLAKQEECMKKIRDLGSLPADAFETYKRKNKKQLQKMLYDCNEQLQQFSHVNKKALDQYVNFTEQREQLQRRRAELDAGDQKIRELISVLDQRKDESIERTFKGVARHFREVFSELVQGGHGHLVMMRKKVSFTGKGETQSMKQLSGGQKTVVALTLIFAIQRCDPAPFYLFDEIDAALDPQYRTAVGNMIRRLADMADTQFIATTFRPEIAKVADKIYGVTHKNRVSYINVVSKEQALDFIEHDQTHNAS